MKCYYCPEEVGHSKIYSSGPVLCFACRTDPYKSGKIARLQTVLKEIEVNQRDRLTFLRCYYGRPVADRNAPEAFNELRSVQKVTSDINTLLKTLEGFASD